MQSLNEFWKFYMFLPLELTLRPSRVYAAVLLLAHAAALMGVWLAVLPGWVRAAMSVALSLSVIWAWREFSSCPRGLRVSQSGLVEILGREWQEAVIHGRPVVLPWLVSLKLVTDEGEKRKLLIWPDSTGADGFRKTRVWLRWGKPDRAGSAF